jgi:predicted tellurium resistance membrane protein TerC
MDTTLALLTDPTAWAALLTLLVMEVVLGIDNLLFISILSNKLPEHQRDRARQVGIGLALVLRLGLLGTISWIIGLNQTVFSAFGQDFTWRELILMAGGLFLVWKATKEIRHAVDPSPADAVFDTGRAVATFGSTIVQILLLDLVFSIDSILTAIGMTDHVAIMVVAVVIAVALMLLAANPLANFVKGNPTVVMLALGFLLMIGMVLIAEGFGAHVPKGYIYGAMAFSALIEGLNLLSRRRAAKRLSAKSSHGS